LVVGGVKTLLLSTSGEGAANVYWPWIDRPEVIDRVAASLSR